MNRKRRLLAGIIFLCGSGLGLVLFFMLLGAINHQPEPVPIALPTPIPPQVPVEPAAVPAPRAMSEPSEVETISEPPEQPVAVMVHGAVHEPKIYRFQEGARVQDGIIAAGNVTERADLDDINIAARLLDDTELFIPFKPYASQRDKHLVIKGAVGAAAVNPPRYTRTAWVSGAAPDAGRPVAPGLSNVTTTPPAASSSDRRLVNLNQATLDELQKLPGIGPKTAEMIDAHRRQQPFGAVEDLERVHGIGPAKMAAIRDLVTVD